MLRVRVNDTCKLIKNNNQYPAFLEKGAVYMLTKDDNLIFIDIDYHPEACKFKKERLARKNYRRNYLC